jgi:hypothetical protein
MVFNLYGFMKCYENIYKAIDSYEYVQCAVVTLPCISSFYHYISCSYGVYGKWVYSAQIKFWYPNGTKLCHIIDKLNETSLQVFFGCSH